jgi:hypothetical protein
LTSPCELMFTRDLSSLEGIMITKCIPASLGKLLFVSIS